VMRSRFRERDEGNAFLAPERGSWRALGDTQKHVLRDVHNVAICILTN
jgi:hypothetical protein